MKKIFYFLAIAIASSVFAMCSGNNNIPIESNWEVEHLYNGTTEISIPTEHTVTLAFLKDGKIAGDTGCNRYFGEFKMEDGENLVFQGIGSTRMMCPEIQFENSFIELLGKTGKYSINKDMLTLKDGSENIIAILKKIAPTASEN